MRAVIQLLIFSTIVMVATAGIRKEGFLKFAHDMKINEKKANHTGAPVVGVVKGMRNCGTQSQSKPVEWRYGSCVDTDAVCHVPTDGVLRQYELDILPSQNINRPLGVRWEIKSTDVKLSKVVDYGVLHPKVLKSGHTYTLHGTGVADAEWKGKDTVFQFIVYDVENNKRVEACAEADIKFV